MHLNVRVFECIEIFFDKATTKQQSNKAMTKQQNDGKTLM
jgi:hypothetical protein